ncbi:MAG: DUF177 domain-containing protein [Armatimonadetes bacterium]|nr:DUF177 domain-containing protein [Armatimonadota bacterium]
MKLDLTEIAHSLGMNYTYEVDDEASDDIATGLAASEINLRSPVLGKLTFSNTGRLLLARGKISTSTEMECVRCLTRFPWQADLQIEEQFPLHPLAGSGKFDEALEDDDLMVDGDLDMADVVFQENTLDLTELIRQNLLVNAPLAVLCKADCRGLCSQCGRNLNEGDCGCSGEADAERHPFYEALQNWKS